MNKEYIIITQENNEYEYNGHLGWRQFGGITRAGVRKRMSVWTNIRPAADVKLGPVRSRSLKENFTLPPYSYRSPLDSTKFQWIPVDSTGVL